MLRELLDYYMTPASRSARNDGFVYEAVAFESRGRRLAADWQSHWVQSHELVDRFCSENPQAESLAILGTGCLFEVPKEKLLQRFQKIHFIDLVFPRSVRRWISNSPLGHRVELHEINLVKMADLGSNLNQLFQADLIMSANLLSQIPLARVAQRSRASSLSLDESDQIRRELQNQHLEMLRPWTGKTLLWTDVERQTHDTRKPLEVIVEQTVFSKMPKPDATWLWHLAPAPEINKFQSIDLAMQGFRL